MSYYKILPTNRAIELELFYLITSSLMFAGPSNGAIWSPGGKFCLNLFPSFEAETPICTCRQNLQTFVEDSSLLSSLSLPLSLSPFPSLSLSVIHTLMHLNTNTLHVLKNTISLLSLYRIPTQMHTDNYARTPTLTHVYLECKMPG